jgi:hypothetical protein
MFNHESVMETKYDELIDKYRPGTLEQERQAIKNIARESVTFALELVTEILKANGQL